MIEDLLLLGQARYYLFYFFCGGDSRLPFAADKIKTVIHEDAYMMMYFAHQVDGGDGIRFTPSFLGRDGCQ